MTRVLAKKDISIGKPVEESIPDAVDRLQSETVRKAVYVQSEIIHSARNFLHKQGFTEILPVICSSITDPLSTTVKRASIDYYGRKYEITRSMIFHKQLAMIPFERIFCFSPNVRLESPEHSKTGRHLAEFVQLDLEVRNASRDSIIYLVEKLILYILKHCKDHCSEALKFFDRDLRIPKRPFPRKTYSEVLSTWGEVSERKLSEETQDPLWLLDMPIDRREFYDKEDLSRPGILLDYDLIYPEGFGEALSGGEREHEPEKIKQRILRAGLTLKSYEPFLLAAKAGKIPPSAGFGIGMERLTRFVCGLPRIEDACLFPKLPGVFSF